MTEPSAAAGEPLSARSILGAPRDWAIDLAVATVVGVFLGVIGPFGSYYGAPVEERVAYWVANLWIGFIALSLIVRLSMRAASRLDLPIWFALAVCVALGAAPLAVIVGHFAAWVWPPNHGRLSPFLVQYGQTLAISEPFAFGYYYLADRGRRRGRLSVPPAPASAASSGPARFLDRLPARLGRDLLCLQMEDHYVRAHTAAGSDLILIPLKQAIAELSGLEGQQVHRSWWVARTAVANPTVDGRNLRLELTNGLTVPVSRPSIARLRAAGWLDRA